jgi:hypothetical protein
VHDWRAIVATRLRPLGLDADSEADVQTELATHLEDTFADARRQGCSDEEAMARAFDRVPDWADLTRSIATAKRKPPMKTLSVDAKTLLVPGMAALCGAVVVVLGSIWLVPPLLWLEPRGPWILGPLLIGAYVGFGALGAAWSRHAGGSPARRCLAGVFPLTLHLAIFLRAIAAGAVTEIRVHPEAIGMNLQLGIVLRFIVAPGIALAVGTLPFLKLTSQPGGAGSPTERFR